MPHQLGRCSSHRPGVADRPLSPARSIVAIAMGFGLLSLALASLGCGGLSVREPVLRNAIVDRAERIEATRQLSSATGAVLMRYGLLDLAAKNPAAAARAVQKRLEAEPVHDGGRHLARRADVSGGNDRRRRSPKSKAQLYRDAAVLAALALEEPGGSRPDLAVRIHNGAVSRLIRRPV